MSYRQLSEEEVRGAAVEMALVRDWPVVRDFFLQFFPNLTTFRYHYSSEYDDETYIDRLRLDEASDATGVLYDEEGLTYRGIAQVEQTDMFKREQARKSQWTPDAHSVFQKEEDKMEDGPVLWLDDGDDSEEVMVVLPDGPKRKYPKLFVYVEDEVA